MLPYLTVARSFLAKAAAFALDSQAKATVSFKDEAQTDYLTNVDPAISAMAWETFAPFLEQGDILIDEEDQTKPTPTDVFASGKPVWVIDPIDGTRPYFNKDSSFGVMLARWENNRFTYAGVHMPARGLVLDITSGTGLLTDLNTSNATQAAMATELPYTQTSVAHIGNSTQALKPLLEAHAGLICKTIPSAAEMTLALAQGKIALMALPAKAGFWDIAPAMAVAEANGYLSFFASTPGKKLIIGPDMFQDDWKLKDDLIITSREIFTRLYPARAA